MLLLWCTALTLITFNINWGVIPYALRIEICPYTMEHDILGLIDPLLVDTVNGLEDLFLTTVEENSSIQSWFAVIVSLEELTVDLLV